MSAESAKNGKVVEARGVNKIFKRDAFEVTALDNVTIDIATGEFLVDLGAPVIVVLGVYVARASARATRVALVVMACYVILPLCLIAMGAMGTGRLLEAPRLLLGPRMVRPLERMMHFIDQPWVIPSFLVIGAVAAVMTVLLAILARRLRKSAASTPPPVPSPPPGAPHLL